MATDSKGGIETIRLLVEENGERFYYTLQGTWLVGSNIMGLPHIAEQGTFFWSIVQSQRGKFVAHCADTVTGPETITIADSYHELATKMPQKIFEELEIALGMQEKVRYQERSLETYDATNV